MHIFTSRIVMPAFQAVAGSLSRRVDQNCSAGAGCSLKSGLALTLG